VASSITIDEQLQRFNKTDVAISLQAMLPGGLPVSQLKSTTATKSALVSLSITLQLACQVRFPQNSIISEHCVKQIKITKKQTFKALL